MASVKSKIVVATAVAALAVACGARGPLDLSPDNNGTADASLGDGPSGDVISSPPDTSVPVDAAPDSPASPIQCATCVATHCGTQLQACITSPSCRTILQCAIMKCASGGKLDPTCLATCAGSDLSGVTDVLAVVSCISSMCGPDCVGVLPIPGGEPVPPDVPTPP